MSETIVKEITWAIGMASGLALVKQRREALAYNMRRTATRDAEDWVAIEHSLKAALSRKASGFIWIPAGNVPLVGIQINKPPPYEQTRDMLGTWIERCAGYVQIDVNKPARKFTMLVDEEGLLKQRHRDNWVLQQLTHNTAIVGDALLCFGRTGWTL